MSFGTVSKSIFASKTFWACVVGASAEIATASGVHVIDDPSTQAEIVGWIMAAAAAFFRLSATQPVHVVPPPPGPPPGFAGMVAGLAIMSMLALSACSIGPQLAATGANLSRVVLSADQVAKLTSTCQAVKPALDIAAAPGMPAQLHDTAVYPQAYCAELLASGAPPPTTDANTPSWLPKVMQDVQIAASVAKVALPLLIPML